MPTTRPRYTLTDGGELSEMLDVAARRWPDAQHRKDLLLRLASAGRDHVAQQLADEDHGARRERQRRALQRIRTHTDFAELESDAAWR